MYSVPGRGIIHLCKTFSSNGHVCDDWHILGIIVIFEVIVVIAVSLKSHV